MSRRHCKHNRGALERPNLERCPKGKRLECRGLRLPKTFNAKLRASRRLWALIWARVAGIGAHSAKSAQTTGGDDGNRTHVQGFAGPCLNHSATSPCQVTNAATRTRPHTISVSPNTWREHRRACAGTTRGMLGTCSSTNAQREKAVTVKDRSTGLADRPSANPVGRILS